MPEFLASLVTKESFVHVAAIFYLSGFLFRDQILLRSLIIVGDIVYVLYFYYAPETPLWGGIFWSSLFVVVNLWMLWSILADRRHYHLTAEERRLFNQLGTLSPGQFRHLLQLGRIVQSDGRTELTRKGEPVEKLFFLTEGEAEVEVEGGRVIRLQEVFIGEIAFLTGQAASATVTIDKGARYVSWPSAALRASFDRQPEMARAMEQSMNRDMAKKVVGNTNRAAE